VFVGGEEGLARGPAEVLGTLLHEAAHALAHVRGIKDTSRQGRWHNTRFKALAEGLGIDVIKDSRIGWSPTTIPTATREVYAEVIADFGRALRLYRAVEITGSRAKKPSPPPCVCECGLRIRVSPTVLAAAPITCGICGGDFQPDQPDSDDQDESRFRQRGGRVMNVDDWRGPMDAGPQNAESVGVIAYGARSMDGECQR
jgi:hypothetical protein